MGRCPGGSGQGGPGLGKRGRKSVPVTKRHNSMVKTIRIASVGPAPCVQGGITRVIELISTHLPSHVGFHQISTFTRYTGDKDAARSERGSRLVQAFVYLWAFLQVCFLALGRRTVFHVHFSGGGSLVRKGLICVMLRSLRCQYAVHSHAADPNLFPFWMPLWCRRLLLWGISGAGRAIVLTSFWRDYYSSVLDLPVSRILLLPNPADLPKSIPDRSAREGLRLIFLGRIGTRKGAFDLVRALAALPGDVRSQCHLTMAGDGETDEARALAAELGCANQVSVTGWVGTAEVARLLAESDVLLLPSRAEGMAMALVEGMSWGLPVVTTSVGGAGEFLEQGANSILVAPGDVQGISDAISQLARDPALRQQLGCAARETISRFSIDKYIFSLYGIYEDLAGRLPGNHSAVVPAPLA
jgi:glycosyltransferase involved in cell wall biosynthesis